MVRVFNGDIENALGIFKNQSEPILKEFKRHLYFTPYPKRKHHRGKTSSGKRSGDKGKKGRGRRY